ncbi:hypothetical protein GH714_040239 [Hevea brasiliensis]|uniref:DUF5110 domain-containing protein n=1 Tax=Hevea brasiliensis TaxID=3981 RepID=A0A6A6MPY9_HEVBR|nr:hypothetical protein GH714_040239 [Hevea brasiliensis]
MMYKIPARQEKGVLFEDDGDGYEFTKGAYLFTRYVAELQSSIVTIFLKHKGLGRGPKDSAHAILLGGVQWGMDGDVVQIIMPLENDVLKSSKHIPNVEEVSRLRGGELSKIPIELKSGTQWLHSRIEIDGYEEYSATEYRSAGCSEEYKVIERDFEHAREDESLILESDIGGGLVLQRQISIRH